MTEKWITKTLANLGFSLMDAKIYFLLASHCPLTARNIADIFKLHKQQVYRILGRLQNRGIVNSSANRPAVFSSLPFEEVLDLFLKGKIEEATILADKRDELLLGWRLMVERAKD